MSALPEDLYDCLAAALCRGTPSLHTEICHFAHGLSLFSSETRRKERHPNVRDIVRVRQTCKAMLAAVRALEAGELRKATNAFWSGAFAGPTEYFCFPSTYEFRSLPWVRESHVQALCYEGKEVLKLYTKRQRRMLKLVCLSSANRDKFRKIIFRIGEESGAGDGDCGSGSDSDDEIPHEEVWVCESELARVVKEWLVRQRAAWDVKENL